MAAFNCELRQNNDGSYADIIYLKTIPAMVDGLLNGGKIADTLLPAYVFNGMRPIGTVNVGMEQADTTLELKGVVDAYVTANGGVSTGCFMVCIEEEAAVEITSGDTVYTKDGAHTSGSFVVHMGDWVICLNSTGTLWGVINNEHPLATALVPGLMSSAHYTKLEGIAPNANNYSHPTQTAIDGNATDDGISVIDRVQVNAYGHVTAVTTRNLAAATPSSPGHMTAAQATKLAGIDDNANNYSHPTGGANVNISASTIETIAAVVVNTLGHVTSFTKQTIRSASTAQTGIVEIATEAEMKAGSSGTLVGSAAGVKAAIDYFATLPVYANLTAANADAPNQPTGKLALVIV